MLNDFDYGIYLNKDIDNAVISTNISTFDDFDLFINKDEYRLLCSLADKINTKLYRRMHFLTHS